MNCLIIRSRYERLFGAARMRRGASERSPSSCRSSRARTPGGKVLAGSLLVDAGPQQAAGRDLRQQLVGLALLVQGLVEEILRVVEAELVGQRAHGAVGGDF